MENCITLYFLGFPGGSVVNNPLANAGDMGLILRLGRSPGEGNGNSLPYSCLGNRIDRRAWWAAVHGVGHYWAANTYSRPSAAAVAVAPSILAPSERYRCFGIITCSQSGPPTHPCQPAGPGPHSSAPGLQIVFQ